MLLIDTFKIRHKPAWPGRSRLTIRIAAICNGKKSRKDNTVFMGRWQK